MSIMKESFVATVDHKSGDRLFWSVSPSNGPNAPDVYALSLSLQSIRLLKVRKLNLHLSPRDQDCKSIRIGPG